MDNKIKFVVAFLIIIIGFIYVHEGIHKTIFENDGCTKARMGFDLKGVYTTCDSMNYSVSKDAINNNIIAEIVGYNIFFVLCGIVAYRLSLED